MTLRESSDIEPEQGPLASMSVLAAVQAPPELRRSLEELVSSAPRRSRGGRAPALRLAGVGALAAAAVAVVLALGGGSADTPTTLAAAQVALAPATLAPPAESPGRRGVLGASVEGTSFPYWGRGWPAVGARTDRLDGRTITTVFYAAHGGKRIGYAIVSGDPLPATTAGAGVERGGVSFRVLDSGGATVVTWREAGHTCILAARGVPAPTLLRLVS